MKRYHYDPKAHASAHGEDYADGKTPGYNSVFNTGDGRYYCRACGSAWEAEDVTAWWPIAVRWNWATRRHWFKSHGWAIGADGIERRIYGRTFHFGPLKVCFGRRVTP